jgi:hypothetical protein
MFEWPDLDARIRQLMLEEIDADEQAHKLYLSRNLSPMGLQDYPRHLREAARTGTEVTLAARLRQPGQMNARQPPQQRGRTVSAPRMRDDAAEVLAEGEFNRFYIRALCRHAVETHHETVVVHRAKVVENPRPESEARIGEEIPARDLLQDLRTNIGKPTRFGLPEVGSGLSVRLS